MREREATAQQNDPLGILNQRPIVLVLATFAVGLAIARTLFPDAPFELSQAAFAAIGFLLLATGILLVATSPYRAPFTRRSFALIVACGLLAVVVEAVSTAGQNTMIRDDWGSTALGLLLLSAAPYRPAREIVIASVVGSVVVAVVVVLQTPGFIVKAPAALFVAAGVTPLLALGIGGAVYSATFVRLVQQWLARASSLTRQSAQELRPGIARSVQQDRVTVLNRDVVPFFSELVERGSVSADDAERATAIASGIRQRLVDDADRSWLENVLIEVCPSGSAGTVVDPDRLAERMSGDQRTAVRAVVKAMAVDQRALAERTESPGQRPAGDRAPVRSSLSIVLNDDDPLVRALVRLDSASGDTALRQRYAPYFAVLRILFRDLLVDVSGSSLTLRFSYDQH
ncbi:hypothetical protein AS850_10620 [Frondihabitans sp. 762G35]|uniref:hypothetical protein n=1 Tax=Frondihabitans sp. 762G35 TaxID=1446794 RepID=UPI000D22A4DB|nr:hypothetical protein [Frondihabitans sp. 762G35]ARC57528.1 hypothetical protein AS850_10620 [Frondihabitans sp. 762G35]